MANYVRVRPGVATGGRLAEGAVGQLKALGFRTIVDLRGPGEGVEAEGQAAEAGGLRPVNIPVTVGAPSDAQVAEFARVIEDAANEPILVHCASGSRVGAMWTLYLAEKGVPVAKAVEEGRAIGMRGEREAAALARLEQPANQKQAKTRRAVLHGPCHGAARLAKAAIRALSSGSRIRATALLGATH